MKKTTKFKDHKNYPFLSTVNQAIKECHFEPCKVFVMFTVRPISRIFNTRSTN